jgi:hypothetical protein
MRQDDNPERRRSDPDPRFPQPNRPGEADYDELCARGEGDL